MISYAGLGHDVQTQHNPTRKQAGGMAPKLPENLFSSNAI